VEEAAPTEDGDLSMKDDIGPVVDKYAIWQMCGVLQSPENARFSPEGHRVTSMQRE
jgi:hypothetical protein